MYRLTEDFSQAADLAGTHPQRLGELKKLFEREAERNGVMLDDRGPARLLGRHTVLGDREEIILGPDTVRYSEDIIRSVFNRSYELVATLDTAASGMTEGLLPAAGGYPAGMSLYVQDDRAAFTYHYFGSRYTSIESETPLEPGRHEVTWHFDDDGGGLGKGEARARCWSTASRPPPGVRGDRAALTRVLSSSRAVSSPW